VHYSFACHCSIDLTLEESELDKSEQATPYKLKRAREKGTIARGIDLGFFTSLAAFVGYAWLVGFESVANIAQLSAVTFQNLALSINAPEALMAQTGFMFSGIIRPMLVFAASIFVVAVFVEFLQVGPVFSFQTMKPDFKRINPAEGLKRIFSLRVLIETLKSLLKLGIYGAITWLLIDAVLSYDAATALDGNKLMQALALFGFKLLFFFSLAALFIAIIDQILSRREFAKKMRMSSRELKRENRDREGDPRLKQKRRDFHTEFLKMVQSLRGAREADVILVNPTHYAVALRYDPDTMEAPKIVSRGSHEFAARIRRIGFLYGVIIIEDIALTQALFKTRMLDAEIPDNLYENVAEIYRKHSLLDRKQRVRSQ
jgi:flagellar biosynthesis protein FlhB